MTIKEVIASSRKKQYGLFIGINKHPDAPLYGCRNDAIRTYTAAMDILGFPKENCTLLLDEYANKENVVKSMKGLFDRATCDDLVWIHISSHGSQLPDKSGDEADGVDECVVLYTRPDQQWYRDCVLRDDDFNYILQNICKSGTRVIFGLDCCHTGTGLRAIGDDLVDNSSKSLARYLPPPDEVIEQLIKIADNNFSKELSGQSDGNVNKLCRVARDVVSGVSLNNILNTILNRDIVISSIGKPTTVTGVVTNKDQETVDLTGDSVLYSGCLATEVSYDIQRSGIPGGAMTMGFLDALTVLKDTEFTYQEFYNKMITIMNSRGDYPKQHPQLEIDAKIKDKPFMT